MKAIIMAGGEGTRLRPLTCNLPKPMVRLFDKPVMEHIENLLRKNGFDDICATLRFMPHEIESYFEGRIRCVTEEEPLGTAGSVKNCEDFINGEDFLVISGDAVCDFDLRKAVSFHRQKNAAVTVVTFRHPNPLEYGLVHTDAEGRIIRFYEKPGWEQVFTDRVNTGIYVISPHIMNSIPRGRSYDFSKDLFPDLMARGERIFACELKGSWCDIGDCSELLRCAVDALNRRLLLDIPAPEILPDVWSASKIPEGVKIIPPCYIGPNVKISEGAVIGPNALICAGSVVGRDATVNGSIVMDARIGEKSSLEGCIVLSGAAIERGGVMKPGTVAGNESRVESGASVHSNVRLWPETVVPPGTDQRASIFDKGKSGAEVIDGRGRISGDVRLDLTPETLIALGAAMAQMGTVGLSCDGSAEARLACDTLSCGLRSAGGHTVFHDAAFLTQAVLAAHLYHLPFSVFTESRGGALRLNLMGRDGLPLSQSARRSIKTSMRHGEVISKNDAASGVCSSVSGIPHLCISAAQKYAVSKDAGIKVAVLGDSNAAGYAKRLLSEIGLDVVKAERRIPNFFIDAEGSLLSITDENGGTAREPRIWILLTQLLLAGGANRLTVPQWAPESLDELAKKFGATLCRAEECDSGDIPLPLRDGAMGVAFICHAMASEGLTLAQLLDRVPDFAAVSAGVPLKNGRAHAMSILSELTKQSSDYQRGVIFKSKNGVVRIRPSSSIPALRIFVEAASMEAASELCAEYERTVKAIDGEPAGKKPQ